MEGYGKRVLVVEDDTDVRTIICAILIEAGYNVYEACDGLEAVDALNLLSLIRSASDGLPKSDSHATRQLSLPPYHVAA